MKEKIKHVRIELEDGQVIEHSGGMLNVSYNYRTAGKGSSKILQSWYEHVVTWHTAIDPGMVSPVPPPVEKADRETLRGIAWCSQHGMEPGECFDQHNPPTAFSGRSNNYLSFKYPNFARQVDEAISAGKNGVMRAYGLTDESLKKWIAKEDSIFPEFDLSDLKEGYGNGHVRPE